MQRILFCMLAGALLLAARSAPDEAGPHAVVQRLFDAMAAHDAAAVRSLFTPDATLVTARADGTASTLTPGQFADRVGASKDAWLERIWNPTVLTHGSIAVVWAEYDFHLNGKFNHCGVDEFNLLKTAAGWKISAVQYTSETSGCAPSPLGPPPE